MKLDFTLAKKFSANNVKGLELRTASLKRAVVFNTSGKGYDKVRAALDSFVKKEEKEGRSPDVRLKGIGKSLEISGEDTLRFLADVNFVNESHNDFIDFFNCGISAVGEPVEMELDEKAALVRMTAEAESEEVFFAGLLPIIEKYDIGIYKK